MVIAKRKKSERQILVAKIDKVFSRLVRERNEYTCQRCEINYEHQKGMMDNSHWKSRGCWTLRWFPGNCSAHCKACHMYFTPRVWAHDVWFEEYYGSGMVEIINERLRERSGDKQYSIPDLRDMLEHYEEQEKIMLRKRKDGVTGWLDFVGWD